MDDEKHPEKRNGRGRMDESPPGLLSFGRHGAGHLSLLLPEFHQGRPGYNAHMRRQAAKKRRPRAHLVALLSLLLFAALPAQANPRVQGGLMLVGGFSEAFAGGTFALGTAETVVGVAGCLYMVSAGVDSCSTGAIMLRTGEHHLQARERALVNMGMSETAASLTVAALDIGVDLGVGAASGSGRVVGRVGPVGGQSIGELRSASRAAGRGTIVPYEGPAITATELRNGSGIVSGAAELPSGLCAILRGREGTADLIPREIGERLSGRQFASLRKFREAFWREVADSPYAAEFQRINVRNLARMRKGWAPLVDASQVYKGQYRFVLHHRIPILQGGGVYELDNLLTSSRRFHREVLDSVFHAGR